MAETVGYAFGFIENYLESKAAIDPVAARSLELLTSIEVVFRQLQDTATQRKTILEQIRQDVQNA